ncbi:hypothetical protein MATL_G00122790 [Megalops atlanticus]|uniref:Uncharacterized protein n=1 Tax=Megalops atlanticus TaxID=7932 RepID=A0A9D3Q3F4_MEGAT|nr:hypothetical protein MATL_G00122790 [Megalops atlanticus]
MCFVNTMNTSSFYYLLSTFDCHDCLSWICPGTTGWSLTSWLLSFTAKPIDVKYRWFLVVGSIALYNCIYSPLLVCK